MTALLNKPGAYFYDRGLKTLRFSRMPRRRSLELKLHASLGQLSAQKRVMLPDISKEHKEGYASGNDTSQRLESRRPHTDNFSQMDINSILNWHPFLIYHLTQPARNVIMVFTISWDKPQCQPGASLKANTPRPRSGMIALFINISFGTADALCCKHAMKHRRLCQFQLS